MNKEEFNALSKEDQQYETYKWSKEAAKYSANLFYITVISLSISLFAVLIFFSRL